MRFPFDNLFFREMEGFYAPAEPERPSAPKLLAFNHALAADLGLILEKGGEAELAALFSGAILPEGAEPLAFAYAGHQFGHFSPQLGDGRALLLGEIVTPAGQRFDVQLKGSGRTAFSRNGDGKAAIGPVLREYLISESMAKMGIATTRALAAVATGDRVQRERAHPGAVLTRIAASHIRIGTFQYFAAHHGEAPVSQLVRHAIARHYPEIAAEKNPALALLDRVIDRQAKLVADWMGVGFVHGVMNTDNMSISGETIDYGPCAFMDRFRMNSVFSSIDRNGRYAYGKQPHILHWNMARLAEALLPSIHAVDEKDVEKAKQLIAEVPARFQEQWEKNLRAKLGLGVAQEGDGALFDAMFAMMEAENADFTGFFRGLAVHLREGDHAFQRSGAPMDEAAWGEWRVQWLARLDAEYGEGQRLARAEAMDQVNPLYIPRNHLVESALEKAEASDMGRWERLLSIVCDPYVQREGLEEFALPDGLDAPAYRTFCGT
ncbi:MAG TPA: YdiU family protein [Sphingopyxis sp.]|nr:YdiU family protein [Sphingopyxis sp.]